MNRVRLSRRAALKSGLAATALASLTGVSHRRGLSRPRARIEFINPFAAGATKTFPSTSFAPMPRRSD